ncbi:exosome complex component-like [Raphidocelis subcapitata]|uniref:Exosome complex component-like n=1 Tax=Raphidocelis subcapitata TaxID=307507 RepID=A0A2V0PJM1_9CHLO|nr:exosome complex component-like [Raphidocelis subcapitata]|eukprot:GBF99994.1 exosome complex component-like [Raphidocelis subcapitata]
MSVTVRAYEHGAGTALIRDALKPLSRGAHASAYVAVGDVIDTDDSDVFLKGHGTQVIGDRLVATQCGAVTRTDKLISVRPPRERYVARAGDVVVGRIVEIAGKRWKVDLQSQQQGSLLLSAVHLPGGVQRRRNAEDELAMRSVFREGDLVSAEVQQVYHDGGVHLHTRSLKFGKLEQGQLVVVHPGLVKRQRSHFISFEPLGVDAILGLNGLIWVGPHLPRGEDGAPAAAGGGGGAAAAAPEREVRERAVRVAAAVRALAALHLQVFPSSITEAYQLSLEKGVAIKDVPQPAFLKLLAEHEAARRHNVMAAEAGGF